MNQSTQNISEKTIPEPRRTHFGWVRYLPGGTLGPRVQNGLQLVAIESGEATITVDGRRRRLAAGDICILGPGRREHFRFAAQQATVHTWCTMFFDAPHDEILPYMLDLPFSAHLTPMLRDLISLGRDERWTSGQTRSLLGNALGRAAYHAYIAAAGAADAPNAPYPRSVAQACKFVVNHLDESIQVDDMARAGDISTNQLTRLFKRHLNTTPSRYLWQTRTQHGVNLLQNTGLGVAEIAYRVGFVTPFHFSRLTKQLYGQSPKALRQQFWADQNERSHTG